MIARWPISRLTWCVLIAFALAAGCATTPDETSIGPREAYRTIKTEAISNASNLHLVNIGDVSGLQELLQGNLYYDVLSLSELLTQKELTHDERETIQKILTLIAVQNEKFPVPKWNSDDQIMPILNSALANNAEYANQLRARNWTKPWWQK